MSYGVNRSSWFTLFLHQNFTNIDGMTLILFFLSPSFNAGPKPRTSTALKINCEKLPSIKARFGSFPSVISFFSTIGIHQISIDQQKQPVPPSPVPGICLVSSVQYTILHSVISAHHEAVTPPRLSRAHPPADWGPAQLVEQRIPRTQARQTERQTSAISPEWGWPEAETSAHKWLSRGWEGEWS